MIKVKLIRVEMGDSCCKGVLTVEGVYVCMTLEPPWKGNKVNESCIPAGVYKCRRTLSPRFNETFEITDVEGRSHILFHSGNKPEHTTGCVLVGKSLEQKICYVKDSRVTRSYFMSKLKGVEEFELTILEC